MAVVLRARPIISISSDISVTGKVYQLAAYTSALIFLILDLSGTKVQLIDLENGNSICTENGVEYQCYQAQICFSFNKATIKQLGGTKNVNMTIVVDKTQSDKQLTARARVGGWAKAEITNYRILLSSDFKCCSLLRFL